MNIFSETDECRKNNGGCAQICEDTVGGHRCSCHPGYELKSNHRDCEGSENNNNNNNNNNFIKCHSYLALLC